MIPGVAITFVVLAGALVLTAAWPTTLAQRYVRALRTWVTWLLFLQCLTACGLIGQWLATREVQVIGIEGLNLYLDGVSTAMLTLVSLVGWLISRYSIRYLDGQPGQGRYFQWMAFTLGAVSFMVTAGNLGLLLFAWLAGGLGLHQLLMFFSERPSARDAAWTKFLLSRVGDAAIGTALVLTFVEFGTLDLAELEAILARGESTVALNSVNLAWVGWLLVVGGAIKSALFPFHTWLPQTMEAPTPVSALMHAGIVNGGGYLIIRTSSLVSLVPEALTALALLGAFTAVTAALIMLTQVHIKRSLAYSTVAQMGFMMLQCGLGAFSAAMLHLIAHSLYKAHAFLSSGSILSAPTARSQQSAANQAGSPGMRVIAAAAITLCVGMVATTLVGQNWLSKPGGLVLGGVACLGLTTWVASHLNIKALGGMLGILILLTLTLVGYAVAWKAVDFLVGPLSVPARGIVHQVSLYSALLCLFFAAAWLQSLLRRPAGRPRIERLYVHLVNGFYLDSIRRRFLQFSDAA